MKNSRIARINDEILREISNVIRFELKDPRVSAMTSITKVDTTNDLSQAKVHVSVLGDEEQRAEVLVGLKNAAGFIRGRIAEKVNLRLTPRLIFVPDDSLAYSEKIDKLLKEINGAGENHGE